VADVDMLRTFNCGIGMVVILPADELPLARDVIARAGHSAWVVGEVVERCENDVVCFQGSLW
jgi:phosphoribosylformylglycinamidine cyclo-ligase